MPRISPALTAALVGLVALGGCSAKELDASGEAGGPGEACEPEGTEPCERGLACEPVAGSDAHVCSARVEIRGTVIDALDDAAIAGALVVASDELGAPVTEVVETDADGRYVLPVSVRRDADGEVAEAPRWMLTVSSADYLPFPGALRPALPIDARDLVANDDEPALLGTIDNAATVVALIPGPTGGVTIRGRVEGDDVAGTLVVAEGLDPAVLAVADVDGEFTLFNVATGSATIRGYRQGLELEAVVLEVAGDDIEDVRLGVITEDEAAMARVEGSVNIVNAPGGSATSVVMIPSSVFDEVLEHGPVPVGLRAPTPPEAPSITSAFEIPGVPAGRFHVLAAFENDGLVRDPDATIAGTQIQQIEVTGVDSIALDESFKITAALELLGPGADGLEEVDAAPTFAWVDDSSEDRYEIVVRDARGEEIWRDDQLPGVSGSERVEVPYAGPALTSGMVYQFRVTAWKDTPQGDTAISRTEDLRGVFVVR